MKMTDLAYCSDHLCCGQKGIVQDVIPIDNQKADLPHTSNKILELFCNIITILQITKQAVRNAKQRGNQTFQSSLAEIKVFTEFFFTFWLYDKFLVNKGLRRTSFLNYSEANLTTRFSVPVTIDWLRP